MKVKMFVRFKINYESIIEPFAFYQVQSRRHKSYDMYNICFKFAVYGQCFSVFVCYNNATKHKEYSLWICKKSVLF